MTYRLTPSKAVPLPPREIALRLRDRFHSVGVSAEIADKQNASFLEKYRRLREAGLGSVGSERDEEVERTHAPGSSLIIQVWENDEASAFVQMLASPATQIDLTFGAGVPSRKRRGLATRIAKAIEYEVQNIEDR